MSAAQAGRGFVLNGAACFYHSRSLTPVIVTRKIFIAHLLCASVCQDCSWPHKLVSCGWGGEGSGGGERLRCGAGCADGWRVGILLAGHAADFRRNTHVNQHESDGK